jgi:hypothetical protein
MPDQYSEPSKEQTPGEEKPVSANPIEQEILELERQLVEKRAEREKKVEEIIGVEEIKQTGSSVQPSQGVQPPSAEQIKSDAAKLSGIEKNQQLKSLVDLAFAKGVAHATEVVRNLDNPYLLDEFHDTLIDEFRKKLVDEGKLEEI